MIDKRIERGIGMTKESLSIIAVLVGLALPGWSVGAQDRAQIEKLMWQ
jgi:hypothetical protein